MSPFRDLAAGVPYGGSRDVSYPLDFTVIEGRTEVTMPPQAIPKEWARNLLGQKDSSQLRRKGRKSVSNAADHDLLEEGGMAEVRRLSAPRRLVPLDDLVGQQQDWQIEIVGSSVTLSHTSLMSRVRYSEQTKICQTSPAIIQNGKASNLKDQLWNNQRHEDEAVQKGNWAQQHRLVFLLLYFIFF
jgi:hypothetical protein